MKTVMIFAPHADDAELGAGGYIAKNIADGNKVVVVVATVGSITFRHSHTMIGEDVRLNEFHASMSALGVSPENRTVLTTGYDSKLNMYPMGDMVGELDDLQELHRPDEVLIPLPSSHQDHRYCWEVGVAATRPSPAKHAPSMVAAYEYPLTCWGDGESASFRGGLYVDIESYWDKKVESLSQYTSQMREGNSLIGIQGAKALAQLRGVECGCGYAELFHVLRIVVR